MKTIPIKRFLDKFPGGIVIMPLLIGCFLNTFYPSVLQIGSFTTGIAYGITALVGTLFLCLGAQLNFKCAKQAVKTGVALTVAKFGIAVTMGLAVAHFFNDNFMGLSCLAIIAGVSNSNGAMFATLTGQYGSESDRGAVAIISINDGPFLTMLAMGVAGAASIPTMSLVAALVPLVIGCILGNLDPDMRKMLSNGMETVIMVSAFAIGCSMNLSQGASGGLSGILLGLLSLLVAGTVCIFADKATGGSGVAGASISSIAANAIATPAALAAIDPAIEGSAGVATAQLASAVIVTCILTPFLTAFVAKRNAIKQGVAFAVKQ